MDRLARVAEFFELFAKRRPIALINFALRVFFYLKRALQFFFGASHGERQEWPPHNRAFARRGIVLCYLNQQLWGAHFTQPKFKLGLVWLFIILKIIGFN